MSGLQWKNPVLGNLLGNVQVSELLGSEDVATINGLSPATDDAYVMEDSGTLTAGSLSVSTGDIVQYNGSAWVIAVANSGGFPPAAAYGLMKDTGTLVGTGFSGYTNGDLVDFDGSTLYGSSSSPTAGYSYVVGDNTTVTGTASTKEGDFLEWSGTAWVALVSGSGGFVPAGERAITGFEPPFVLISPYVDATDDGEIVEFSGSSNTGADTGDSSDGSSVLVQDPAHVGVYDNLAYVFEGTTPTGSWIQWSGAGQINAGLGLTKSGNTINVGDAGKGVQVNADDLEFSAAEAVAASGGLKAGSNSWQLAVEPNDFAGTGLVDDGADNLAIDEATGSVTFTGGTWTYPVDVLQVTGTPNSGNDAVNKTYVDGQISTSGVFRSEVSTIQLVGNLTVSGINALGTGSEIGDAYVVTDAGTPTQGSSDTMAAGDIAEWNGTSWFKIEANSGGFVPSGVRAAITTNTPASPYTSSQDEGKIVEFSGSSNTGTNTGETTDAIVLMVKPISGESIYDKTLFHFDGTVPTGFWLPIYPNRSWIGDGLDHTGDSFEVLPDTTSGGSSGIAPVTVGANGVGLTVSNIAGTGLRREPGEYNLEVDPASTVTFSGATWTFPVDDLQVTGTPNTGNDAVNKTYVDSVVASSGFMLEPVRTTELVGNLTIAGINALGTSANEGDAYVTTDAGTPTQGTSDSMVAGSIAEWDGTSWIEIAEGSGGFVPSGVRVALTSGTLISPYTDSTDNGKIAEFSGSSNTGTLTSEAATGRSVVVQGDGSLPGVPYFNNVMATFEGSVPTGFWHITHPSRLWVDDGITIDGAQIGVLADTTTGGNYEPVQVGADGVSILISNIAGTGLEADGSANLRLASPGDGLTGGAGSPIAVLGLNSSIDVTASGVEAAVPSTANKNMTASATSSDGDQATVTTVAAAFANGSYPVMLVNGIQEPVSSGDKTGVFYFSGDGGTNARTFAAVQAGDTIHFNGSIATYELTASDRLDILFNDAV